jgi:hypothetical protein
MMQGKCKRCSGTLIEIEDHGTRLIGCLACNDWRSIDGLRRVTPTTMWARCANCAVKMARPRWLCGHLTEDDRRAFGEGRLRGSSQGIGAGGTEFLMKARIARSFNFTVSRSPPDFAARTLPQWRRGRRGRSYSHASGTGAVPL